MNTFEDLIQNGIEPQTAVFMLDSYSRKIGTMNGIYKITDITYDFKEHGRIVTLKCSSCGREIKRTMISGRNKWSELIRTCPCEKEARREAKRKAELQKKFEKKKALIEELKSRIGMTFDDYIVVALEDVDEIPKYTLRCKECGAEKIVRANPFLLKDFHCTKHCRRIKYDDSYIGRTSNYLTVVDIVRNDKDVRKFLCECTACDKQTLVEPANWESGTVKSCGCMRDKLLHDSFWKEDALSRQRPYRIWGGMKQRCYNTNSHNYPDCGGRWISICDEWLDSYETFKNWALENGYSDELSIDRINVNGNYEPSNCRWADWDTQLENRRPRNEWKKTEKTWTINGETKPRKEWCEQYNTSLETVNYRVNHKGMTLIDALTTPKIADGRPRKGICL